MLFDSVSGHHILKKLAISRNIGFQSEGESGNIHRVPGICSRFSGAINLHISRAVLPVCDMLLRQFCIALGHFYVGVTQQFWRVRTGPPPFIMYQLANVWRRSWNLKSSIAASSRTVSKLLSTRCRSRIAPGSGGNIRSCPRIAGNRLSSSANFQRHRYISHLATLQLCANGDQPFPVLHVAPLQAEDFRDSHSSGDGNQNDQPQPEKRLVNSLPGLPVHLRIERRLQPG